MPNELWVKWKQYRSITRCVCEKAISKIIWLSVTCYVRFILTQSIRQLIGCNCFVFNNCDVSNLLKDRTAKISSNRHNGHIKYDFSMNWTWCLNIWLNEPTLTMDFRTIYHRLMVIRTLIYAIQLDGANNQAIKFMAWFCLRTRCQKTVCVASWQKDKQTYMQLQPMDTDVDGFGLVSFVRHFFFFFRFGVFHFH